MKGLRSLIAVPAVILALPMVLSDGALGANTLPTIVPPSLMQTWDISDSSDGKILKSATGYDAIVCYGGHQGADGWDVSLATKRGADTNNQISEHGCVFVSAAAWSDANLYVVWSKQPTKPITATGFWFLFKPGQVSAAPK